MSKIFLGFLFIASFALLTESGDAPDCLDKIGGVEKVVGKKLIEDGIKLTKEYIPYNPNAEEIKQSTLPDPYRILRPNGAMTMDLRTNRINLEVDDKNIITRAFCV